MTVRLDEARRQHVVSRLQGFHRDQFDEEISVFRAEQLLDFLLEAIGPQIYNQAVQDARGFMQKKLEDMDVEVHELDELI